MTDHETFVLLAAKQLSEPLSPSEEADLAAHLTECPACRSIATGMRRDNFRLHGELAARPVSPRVRSRVLEEASGRRRIDARLVLGLAAVLLLGLIAVPFFAGGPTEATPPPSAIAELPSLPSSPSPEPSPLEPFPSPLPSPTASTTPPAPETGPFVAAAYTYGQRPPRKDTVVARFEDGKPVGEWSRIMPADGSGDTWAGPITCLVFDGSDVWLAGPATTSDGETEAVMIHLHDGGPGGENDSALIWLAPEGQTITTVTNWCLTKFEPADLSPLTDGNIDIQIGP